ncbi:AMP-binding protein [uncultured Pseudosulfitobacter sp.]|uniref:AMP-binding protein n=1 Tax=uncultured Pseudosulfitobacter sp. TaxID=2854214 RepID=UPI0030DAFE14|tara:strand:+ start:5934 stop:7643 length:1710 start_codon:yes stop_codon:yes gene_type:complete
MTRNQQIEEHIADLRHRQAESWPKGVSRDINHRLGQTPMSQYLRAEAKARPDDAMVHYYGRTLSWAEIDGASDRFAGLLQARGVNAGDRVAVMMGNCPQFLICFWGIMKLGAILVPVNPMFKGIELTYQLNDSGAQTLVFQDDLAPLVASVAGDTPVRMMWATGAAEMAGDGGAVPRPTGMGDAPQADGIERLLDALKTATPFAGPDCTDLDAVAALNYTGGTTGMPKGCVHTHGDMLYTAASFCGCAMADAGPDDVMVNFFPMFWIAGEDLGVLAPVYTGAAVSILHRWDAVGWMATVAEHRATIVTLLVDNAVEVMRHPRARDHDLTSLRTTSVCSFVKKLGAAFRNEWRALTGATMVELAYGMTETNTCDTFTLGLQDDDYDLQQQPVFVGLPVPETDIIICDFETGALKPIGETGEICLRSPSVLKSYWNKPDATAHALRDGWLHTGDIGLVNTRGFVHYLGRRKEMLKVNGMPVFPTEIEMLLGRHPAILGSGVIGRKDEAKGEVPVAFVHLDPEQAHGIDADSLRAWCREQMASFKVPEIRLVDGLPMTATGKVKKEELAALL